MLDKRFEVEQKYPIRDASRTLAELERLGVAWRAVIHQSDLYFAHPQRDFARTDEALRIRSVRWEDRQENCVTYKGPRLEAQTKTREELEVALAAGDGGVEPFAMILTRLGFREVTRVNKRRRVGSLEWSSFDIEVAWDEVEAVGSFLELEVVTDPAGLADAQQAIQALGQAIGLPDVERRSYLELVLDQQPSA